MCGIPCNACALAGMREAQRHCASCVDKNYMLIPAAAIHVVNAYMLDAVDDSGVTNHELDDAIVYLMWLLDPKRAAELGLNDRINEIWKSGKFPVNAVRSGW